jgi:DNA-binding response OmpR family regulator
MPRMRLGTRVLIVEDDLSIARLVELELKHRGFEVRCAHDGLSGIEVASEFDPDVIVLDIMLPGLDGVGVLGRLRASGNKVPVLMLTARDASVDKIHSLDLGADDYLTKPFDMGELMARIRVMVRRVQGDEVLCVADLEIDTAARSVRRAGREVELTTREYDLLEFMARNHRRVLSRELILERVWHQDFYAETNVVDVYVGYLRKKLGTDGGERLIRTVRGVGYVLRGE